MDEIPSKWKLEKLGNVTQKIQDGNYGADYPKSDEFQSEGVPFLTSRAIESTNINWKNIDYISEEKHIQLRKAHIKTNDVLWTNRGAKVGSVAIVPLELNDANIGPQLTLIRVEPSILDYYFLYCYMQSSFLRKQIESKSSGSAMGFFGIAETSNFILPLPPLAEQRKIAAILSTWDEAIGLTEALIGALERRKQALMQLLLTGAVRFQEFEGEMWENLEVGRFISRNGIQVNPLTYDEDLPCIELEHIASGSGQILGYTPLKGQKSIKNYFSAGQIARQSQIQGLKRRLRREERERVRLSRC